MVEGMCLHHQMDYLHRIEYEQVKTYIPDVEGKFCDFEFFRKCLCTLCMHTDGYMMV